MEKRTKALWRRILLIAAAAAILPAAVLFTKTLETGTDSEALALAEKTIRRAAVECYALEGAYPASVEHLYETYGVSVDREKYVVYYGYVGSNLLPDITVLPVS